MSKEIKSQGDCFYIFIVLLFIYKSWLFSCQITGTDLYSGINLIDCRNSIIMNSFVKIIFQADIPGGNFIIDF